MDESIDPCVDFSLTRVAGGFGKTLFPRTSRAGAVYGKLQDDNQAQLRGILDSAAAATGERSAYAQKIGYYYASCMDEKGADELGATPLKNQLETIESLGSKVELADLAADMVFQGALFRFRSDQDYGDSTQVIAEADLVFRIATTTLKRAQSLRISARLTWPT